MAIVNKQWVADMLGKEHTFVITGTVTDVVEAGDEAGGVFVVAENEENGERGRSYLIPPLTPDQEAARLQAIEDRVAAEEADRAAEADRVEQERAEELAAKNAAAEQERLEVAAAQRAAAEKARANLADGLGAAFEAAGIDPGKIEAAKAALLEHITPAPAEG